MKSSTAIWTLLILSVSHISKPIPKKLKAIEKGICNKFLPEIMPYCLSAYTFYLAQQPENFAEKETLENMAKCGLILKLGVDVLRVANSCFKRLPEDDDYECKMQLSKYISRGILGLREALPYAQIGMIMSGICESGNDGGLCSSESTKQTARFTMGSFIYKIASDGYRTIRELQDNCITCENNAEKCYWNNDEEDV